MNTNPFRHLEHRKSTIFNGPVRKVPLWKHLANFFKDVPDEVDNDEPVIAPIIKKPKKKVVKKK
jgi:hypothetical protein